MFLILRIYFAFSKVARISLIFMLGYDSQKILPISRASFSYSYLRLLTISLYAWKNSRSFVFFGKHLIVTSETSIEHDSGPNRPRMSNFNQILVSNECRSLIEIGIKMIDDFRSCISRSSQSKQIDSPKQ